MSPRALSVTPARVARPLCAAAIVAAAAMAWPASASADTDSVLLNSIGIGNNGPVSTVIAQIGTGMCPMLVKPGSTLAGNMVSDKGQLASQIAGGLAGLAIQTQCPAFMTRLANGDLSVLTNAASMLGLSDSTTTNPLSIAGLTTSNPIALPGL